MAKYKLLVIIVFFYLFFQIITISFLFYKVYPYLNLNHFTIKAPAEIKFCINHQPKINYTCNNSILQDETFYCELNATDQDNNSFLWDLYFISGPKQINLINNKINYTPNASFIGNYSFSLTVWDNSNCNNNYDYGVFNLTVINVNDAPVLIKIIPNQTFVQDSSVSFDLDEYFFDADYDLLSYTTIPNSLNNILVSIDSNNIVTFTPIQGWTGEEFITFIAWDPYYENTTSNLIKIVVSPNQINAAQKSSSSSSSNGKTGNSLTCLPMWYCKPFGKCEPDNLKRRECFDLNNCSINFGKPNLTEPCIFESTCFDGFKGQNEEDIDCGGVCPPCGNCYDNICNNNEDCVFNLTKQVDCGGSCLPCIYEQETCFDFICNNNEDCTKGLTDIPDCGGSCLPCLETEKPLKNNINYAFFIIIFILILLLITTGKISYPYFLSYLKKRKKKYYEEKLILEASVSESIFDSIRKIEELIEKEDKEKLILLLSQVIRRYFKTLFNLRYEFTYEELIKEINSRKVSQTFKNVFINFFDKST
ncbi:MAG: Ig-like domain-containing protein, partial [Candidatus Woesearchaeota archaeon]